MIRIERKRFQVKRLRRIKLAAMLQKGAILSQCSGLRSTVVMLERSKWCDHKASMSVKQMTGNKAVAIRTGGKRSLLESNTANHATDAAPVCSASTAARVSSEKERKREREKERKREKEREIDTQ